MTRIKRADLQKALRLAVLCTKRIKLHPLASAIRLKTEKNSLSVEATDFNQLCRFKIPAEVGIPFDYCFDSEKLINVIEGVKLEELELSAGSSFYIGKDGVDFEIDMIEPDYPKMIAWEKEFTEIKVECKALSDAIYRTYGPAHRTKGLAMRTFGKDKIRMLGASKEGDRFVLGDMAAQFEPLPDGEYKVWLLTKPSARFLREALAERSDSCLLRFRPNTCEVEFQDSYFITRLLEGNPTPVKQPRGEPSSFKCKSEDLLRSVRLACAVNDTDLQDKGTTLQFEAHEDKAFLRVENENGRSQTRLNGYCKGKPFTLYTNAKQMLYPATNCSELNPNAGVEVRYFEGSGVAHIAQGGFIYGFGLTTLAEK